MMSDYIRATVADIHKKKFFIDWLDFTILLQTLCISLCNIVYF